MQSLFNPAVSQSYIDRINNLTPQTQAKWGKMSVDQMLAHCNEGARMIVGDTGGKRILLGYLFGAWAKKDMLSEKPFKQGLPTAKNFVKIGQNYDFDAEKAELISLITRYNKGGQAGLTKYPHSFFGVMQPAEWDHLMSKHLNHHLQQFGV